MVSYRLVIAAVLLIAWVVAAASAGDGCAELIQTSKLLLTNVDTADTSQNDDLSAVAFHPIGLGLFKVRFLSVKSIEGPMPWRRKGDDSYQLNCAFLL